MRQSLVALPQTPMRPRYADPRAGFFTVQRVNYGLDEQKAATQTFITRWRLEPKDPAAYARGELVEPVTPIVYYIDPATPTKWRPYVRRGVEDWQKAFEKAGFRNAIARRSAERARGPNWDAEDIRHSVVRWAASTTRNAVGPSRWTRAPARSSRATSRGTTPTCARTANAPHDRDRRGQPGGPSLDIPES